MDKHADRYQVVRTGAAWRVKIGDGTQTLGIFLLQGHAHELAAHLQRAFLDGQFVAETERDAEIARLTAERDALRAALKRLYSVCVRYGWLSKNDTPVEAAMNAAREELQLSTARELSEQR